MPGKPPRHPGQELDQPHRPQPRDPAGARPARHRLDGRGPRQRRDPRHGPPGPLPRDRRGDAPGRGRRRGDQVKLHDLKPAPGLAQGEAPRRTRHRRRPGQDRGSRHQGPEGASRRQDPGLVRGRPDAAPPAHPEAARLPEPVQDRRSRSSTSATSPALVELGELEGGEMPGRRSPRRRARAPITVNQEILRAAGLVRRLDRPMKVLGGGELSTALFVVADAFSASARSKIEAAGGTVSVLEVPGPSAARPSASPTRPPSRPRREADEAPAAAEAPACRRGTPLPTRRRLPRSRPPKPAAERGETPTPRRGKAAAAAEEPTADAPADVADGRRAHVAEGDAADSGDESQRPPSPAPRASPNAPKPDTDA